MTNGLENSQRNQRAARAAEKTNRINKRGTSGSYNAPQGTKAQATPTAARWPEVLLERNSTACGTVTCLHSTTRRTLPASCATEFRIDAFAPKVFRADNTENELFRLHLIVTAPERLTLCRFFGLHSDATLVTSSLTQHFVR